MFIYCQIKKITTCQVLLYLLLLLGEISCNYFDLELFMEKKQHSIVHKCCPKSKHSNYGKRPLHCCQDGLFSNDEEGYLLKECADLGVKSDSIIKTIRCAQKEMYGEGAVDICKVYCCKLFEDNNCSKICLSNITKADMSINKFLDFLKNCNNNENYGAVYDCIHSKTPKNMEQKYAADLEIYCKSAINMV
uniref:DB domain-containing protein n=1 Tax=Meloidogyne hapla TaxID=6305 RepID=A0A1I8AYU8_MELHA